MTVDVRVLTEVPADADVVTVPAFCDRLAEAPANDFLAAAGFGGQVGETVLLPGADGGAARIVVGLGKADAVDMDVLRRAAAAVARTGRRYTSLAFVVPAVGVPSDAVRAVAESALLALYRFTRYKSSPEADGVGRLTLVTPAGDSTRASRAAQRVAAAVSLARDLGNEPGGSLTPSVFAERAAALATESGLACDVWDCDRITAERLGGLLGVNRGSEQPPRLVRLAYEPPEPAGTVALVGKGVTFDSGGLTLKPNQMMTTMKIDMAGAAAVLAALTAMGDLACPIRVIGWLPLTDNMPGGDATRIGDVLRTRSGTTVEVRNADAEGRLILADALTLATEEGPDAVVDIATLTDAVPMAVGRRYAGLAGNNAGFLAHVQASADRAGELVWPLPLTGAERKQLDSKVADLVNATGSRYGQSTIATLFLKQFVPDAIPWAHLDIAGPAFCEDDDGECSAGATGFGVRTLIELARTYRPPAGGHG